MLCCTVLALQAWRCKVTMLMERTPAIEGVGGRSVVGRWASPTSTCSEGGTKNSQGGEWRE